MGEKLRLYRYQTNGAKIPNKLPDNRSGDFLDYRETLLPSSSA